MHSAPHSPIRHALMEEECSDASKRRKIESTVLHILKASDLETATEFCVRSAAAVNLGFELSCLSHRRLVRQLIHSFLLSTAADILRTDSLHRINDRKNTDENADSDTTQPQPQPQPQPLSDVGVEMEANYNGKVICKLSDRRRVTIHDMSGTAMVAIRDFYIKDGNMLPKKGANSGLSLTSTQWSSFRNSFPSIQEAIFKLESESRPAAVPKLSECIMTNSVADSASEKGQSEGGISNGRRVVFPPVKRMQNGTETDTRNSVRNSAAEKSQTRAGISNLGSTIPSHIKSKQTEADTSKAVISSNYHERIPVERKQEAAGTSLPVSTVPPHIKTKQTEADTYDQERIPVEGRQEAARTSFPVATSSHQETVSASRNETKSDIAPLGPLSPTQKQHGKHNAIHPQNLIPGERNQPEADISTSVPSFPSQWHLHSTTNTIGREQLIPVQTTRFDGRNYHSWSHQMEFFLNQLNIAYVLSEPCPSLSFSPEASSEEKVKLKAATQRWIADDYICHHNILNSLCDNLFQKHSQKSCSARELWEELKFVYNEDFGTTRSQINEYIQFQMVDGVSVLEQVQELHRIVNSVIASGTWIDETFHVSVIVSKLPPSWKELRFRLMQEEFLPLNMLMHCLRVEEESRYKKLTDSRKDHAIELKLDCRIGMRKHENRRACYSCGKEGHIFKNCPDRKSESCDKSCAKENGAVAPCTSAKIINAEKPS